MTGPCALPGRAPSTAANTNRASLPSRRFCIGGTFSSAGRSATASLMSPARQAILRYEPSDCATHAHQDFIAIFKVEVASDLIALLALVYRNSGFANSSVDAHCRHARARCQTLRVGKQAVRGSEIGLVGRAIRQRLKHQNLPRNALSIPGQPHPDSARGLYLSKRLYGRP